jgi:hypothetical protein
MKQKQARTDRGAFKRAFAGLAVAALVLSACGGDEADSGTTSTDSGSAAESPTGDSGVVDGVVVRLDGEDRLLLIREARWHQNPEWPGRDAF